MQKPLVLPASCSRNSKHVQLVDAEMSCVSDVRRAVLLRASFPSVAPLELLDLVFEDQLLPAEACSALLGESVLAPAELAFVAAAFDRGMCEEEWLGWQRAPAAPELQAAVRSLWREYVVPAFTQRYAGSCRPRTLAPEYPPQRAFRTL